MLAAIDCKGNVTIGDSDDANKISEKCETIGGSLTIESALRQNLTIKNLKTVHGTVSHDGCLERDEDDDDGDCDNSDVTITFHDLVTVGGDLKFSNSSINVIKFPELRVVNGTV